ncbi:MAG: Uncharacterised protein [Prochlorococcus marinus str. MIT 9215]|nr:MAG: Uncharacterised protein [Prochlorococcus marinus str. MIT 9215]
MHDVNIEATFDDCSQQVVGAVDVVVDGVALGGAAFHRVRSCPLLSEVHHCIGPLVFEHGHHAVVFLGDIQVLEAHRLSADFFPGTQAFTDVGNRCQ